MKKTIFCFLLILAVFVSCTDRKDAEIVYRPQIGITAAHIFDDYEPFMDNDFDMGKDGWKLNLQVLIYDEQGHLVDKAGKLCSSLSDVLTYDKYLAPGNYTVISIADFRDGLGGEGYRFWNLDNESDLKDLSITENETIYPVVFETLGIDVRNVEITDSMQPITADIKPVTSLVEIFMSDKDYAGWGVDGYSRFSVLTDGYFIKALKFKNNIRFKNGQMDYRYSEQISDYNIAVSYVYEKWTNREAPTGYNYRALLPETDKGFSYHIQKRDLPDEYYDQFVILCGEFDTEGLSNVLPEIKSNTQYEVTINLDAMQLVAFEYTDDFSHERYTLQYVSDYNRKLIDEMVHFGYEEIVGLPESTLRSYLQAEPYGYNESGTVAYYSHSHSSHFEKYVTVRYETGSREKSNRIMLQLPVMDNDMVAYLVNELGNTFTRYSNVGNVYQFTDKATVQESRCGIILSVESLPTSEIGSNDNICLYFDYIK